MFQEISSVAELYLPRLYSTIIISVADGSVGVIASGLRISIYLTDFSR